MSSGLPAVAWRGPTPPPGYPSTRSLRLVRATDGLAGQTRPEVDEEGAGEDASVERGDPAELPDPRQWATLLAQAIVEVLSGRRPVGQVVRWVDPEIAASLRASAPGRADAGRPVLVRRVRVSTHLDGSVEAAVVVDDADRCRALALRLEALRRRWVCTALELV